MARAPSHSSFRYSAQKNQREGNEHPTCTSAVLQLTRKPFANAQNCSANDPRRNTCPSSAFTNTGPFRKASTTCKQVRQMKTPEKQTHCLKLSCCLSEMQSYQLDPFVTSVKSIPSIIVPSLLKAGSWHLAFAVDKTKFSGTCTRGRRAGVEFTISTIGFPVSGSFDD